jgi:hypothetical protein
VIKIIKTDHKLLDTKILEVVNRKGQRIRNNKPFSLAFGAGDHEMCWALKKEMIHFYGEKDAEAKIQEQLSDKIGEENKEEDEKTKKKHAALLEAVIEAISNEQFDSGSDNKKMILRPATLEAITTFRKEFAALQPEIIDKGMHFRLNTVQETFDAYITVAPQWAVPTRWGDTDYHRGVLFEDGALSSVLAYLPENDAQRCSQGLGYLQPRVLLQHPEKFNRSLKLHGTQIDFYDQVGRDSANFAKLSGSRVDIVTGFRSVYMRGGLYPRSQWPGAAARTGPEFAPALWKNLYQTKTLNLQRLYPAAGPHQAVSVRHFVK